MSQFNGDDQDFKYDLDSIIDLVQVDQLKATFFEEAHSILSDLEDLIGQLEKNPHDFEITQTLFRKIHTLKGNVGAIPGGQMVGSIAHEFEAVLGKIKDAGVQVNDQLIDIFFKSSRILSNLINSLKEQRELYPEELSEAIELISEYGALSYQSRDLRIVHRSDKREANSPQQHGIWLSSDLFENFMRLSGELLVLKNSFAALKDIESLKQNPVEHQKRQDDFILNLSKISDQLQNQIKVASHEKAKSLFKGLYVLVRQVATELNKDVHFSIEGEDVLLDKFLAREIYDSLVHILRNSLDHGIEDQFERATQGKSPKGQIKLVIENHDNEVLFKITDDGLGLNREKIMNKAVNKGLVSLDSAEQMTDSQIYSMIFEHGFSTREKVTTLSGRGVGMDVVKTSVLKLKGSIDLSSEQGQGLEIIIRIPHLRHIIVDSILLCQWQDSNLAIPLTAVERVVPMNEAQIIRLTEGTYLQIDGKSVLLCEYKNIYDRRFEFNKSDGCLVIIRHKQDYLALYVDKVETQTELVVKEFDDIVKKQRGCKGLSVLSDERIVYVIDPESLIAEFFVTSSNRELEAA